MPFFRNEETYSINMRKELSRYRVLHAADKRVSFTPPVRVQTGSLQHRGLQTSGLQTSSLQTSGLQTSSLQTSGLQTSGLQTSGLQTSGLQTSSLQTYGLQSDGLQSEGLQPDGLWSGSLTVEAALVLPMFLIMINSLLFLFQVMIFQVHLQAAMDYAVQKASAYYYAVEQIQKGEDAEAVGEAGDFGKELLAWGITAAYLKGQLLSEMDERFLEATWLQGGSSGLTLIQSQFPDEEGAIDLVVSYRVRIPFWPGRIGTLTMSQRSRRLVWTGTVRWKTEEENQNEKMVYLTENGSVYHVNPECSHLHLSIRTVWKEELSGLRNQNGGKYNACERCVKLQNVLQVYITDSGDKYHNSLSCPGLVRNIRQAPLSEISLPPCSRCGKETF